MVLGTWQLIEQLQNIATQLPTWVLTFFPLKNSPPNKISSSFSGCAHREAFNLRRARAVNQEQTRDSHLYTRARTWGTVGDTQSPTPASFSRPETEILLLTPLNPPNSIKHRIKLWHLCWFSVLSVNGGIKLTHLLSFWSFWYFLLHFSGCFLRSFHFLFFFTLFTHFDCFKRHRLA